MALGLLSVAPSSEEDILAGTDDGRIVSFEGGENSQMADLEGVVHEIKRSEETVFASTQSGNNSSIYRVEEKTDRIYSSNQSFHGFAVSEEAIFLAYEDSGKIVKITRDGETLDEIKTGRSPHQLIYKENSLYAGNINGSIQVFSEKLETERDIKTGSWMGSFSVNNENIYVAGRKRLQVNTSGHMHTVTKGFVSEIKDKRNSTVLLPTTFVPHGIQRTSEDKVAVTNMVDGKVALVDFERGERVEEIALEPRSEPYFTSLLDKNSEYLVAGDIEKSRLYLIKPSDFAVDKTVVIEGIHSVEVS